MLIIILTLLLMIPMFFLLANIGILSFLMIIDFFEDLTFPSFFVVFLLLLLLILISLTRRIQYHRIYY